MKITLSIPSPNSDYPTIRALSLFHFFTFSISFCVVHQIHLAICRTLDVYVWLVCVIRLLLMLVLKQRLSATNPVSRNDNVDDALNIIEIEVALIGKNIHFFRCLSLSANALYFVECVRYFIYFCSLWQNSIVQNTHTYTKIHLLQITIGFIGSELSVL